MLVNLDHYTVCARDLNASIDFYESVLGLKRGKRPNFNFPGAWLYAGAAPIVHLVGDRAKDQPGTTGHLDHIAFLCRDLPAFRERLKQLGQIFDERRVPDQAIIQLFLIDPDGIKVELNFPLA